MFILSWDVCVRDDGVTLDTLEPNAWDDILNAHRDPVAAAACESYLKIQRPGNVFPILYGYCAERNDIFEKRDIPCDFCARKNGPFDQHVLRFINACGSIFRPEVSSISTHLETQAFLRTGEAARIQIGDIIFLPFAYCLEEEGFSPTVLRSQHSLISSHAAATSVTNSELIFVIEPCATGLW
ncbi:hypothetical protein PENSTE_c011G03673 [Penicillium steckii]|uniref:Uncharacterized protein n=1 Tax=Penicillium steckii TaxID=303698 RepID=A0A1V6T805_9EURO|nr:hypothetical protein PENSTE_c011G03673 [Penicillium steckii]